MLNKKQTEELTEQIIDILHTVYDPEIPVDVYELGLIYDVQVDEKGEAKIIMTLTSPNCPMIESLPEEIRQKTLEISGIESVDLQLTFEPAWDKDMMSDEAKLQLGFL